LYVEYTIQKNGRNILRVTVQIKYVIMAFLFTTSYIISQVAYGSELTVNVFFKYSSWQVQEPEKIGNIRMSWSSSDTDEKGSKNLNLQELPAVTTIENFNVPMNSNFQVCLNSEERDDGNCEQGINQPDNVPEALYIEVP
jgi:hypothetical protein